MSGFTLLPGDEPDEIDLELAAMGAPLDADQGARIEAAARGPLAEVRTSIEVERAAFRATRRPLPRRSPWALRGAAALAIAAAALIVALALGGPADPGVRAMGGLPVDLVVRHDGPAPAEGFAVGDELFVRLRAPDEGVVEVWTLQADGVVSLLEPGRRVRAGEAYALDGAARLDDNRGREWLVVALVDDHRGPATIDAEARSLLPDPSRHAGPRRFVVEVTRRP